MNINKIKKWVLLVLILLLLLVVVNFNFFWHNVSYYFKSKNISFKHETITEIKNSISPNTILIPSLGINAPIQYVDEKTEKAYQTALKNGVVHYPGTAKPGEPGNVYIFGHSSDYLWSDGKYKTVFAELPKIKLNEEIFVVNEKGESYVYVAKKSFSASAKEVSLLNQDRSKKILTLQTSWPLGTAFKRWIVVAELVTP